MKKVNQIITILAVAFLAACSSEDVSKEEAEAAPIINPPFQGVNVDFQQMGLNAEKGGEFTLGNGTKIIVPPNAMVDADGNSVTGEVDFNYRDFHDLAEVMVSGIPMSYDSAGVSYDFRSAGMFEMTAQQNGKEVFIKEGKGIEVQMASFTEGEDFNFYQLNEETGGWKYEGKTASIPNEGKELRLKTFKDNNVFHLSVDYSTFTELKAFDQLSWTYIGNDPAKDPIQNEWVFQERWRKIKLDVVNAKRGEYKMKLKSAKNKLEILVSPYILGDRKEGIEKFNESLVAYNGQVQARKEKEDKIRLEADILRSFPVTRFGKYNWDKAERMLADGSVKMMNGTFAVNGQSFNDEYRVYHITDDGFMRQRKTKFWEKMIFEPQKNNKILVILDKNKVAVCNKQEFDKIASNPSYEFQLKEMAKEISSVKQLKEVIASI